MNYPGILSLSLLFLLTTQAQSKPKLFEYIVKPGDTCSKIAEERFGDPKAWDKIHIHNPQLGFKLPHKLKPGSRLQLPAPEPDAKLTEMEPQVNSRATDAPVYQEAKLNQELYRGWRINTLENGTAEITFQNQAQIHLHHDTLVIIFGPTTSRIRTRSRATLARGSLRSHLGELAGTPKLLISSPSAETHLGEGQALLSVDKVNTTRLSNHAGKPIQLEGKRGRGKVEVVAGMGSSVKQGQRPSKPKLLPPSPSWSLDSPSQLLNLSGEQPKAWGRWEPVSKASAYRVELARSPDGSQILVITTVPAPTQRFEIRGLPLGTYYARVSALDAQGFESKPSPIKTIKLLSLEFSAPDGSKIKGNSPLPLGSWIEAPEGVSCAQNLGSKARRFQFKEPGQFKLSCVDKSRQLLARPKIEVLPAQSSSAPSSQPQESKLEEPAVPKLTEEYTPLQLDPLRALSSAFATIPSPRRLSLRDEQRMGLHLWVAEAPLAEDSAGNFSPALPSLGVGFSLFNERLMVRAAHAFSIEPFVSKEPEGALFGSLGLRLLRSAFWGLGLSLDLSVWAPTLNDHSGARFLPSLEGSLRQDRFALRLRQGYIRGLEDESITLWSGGYGLEFNLWRALSLGIEADTAFGEEQTERIRLISLGPSLAWMASGFELTTGALFGVSAQSPALSLILGLCWKPLEEDL